MKNPYISTPTYETENLILRLVRLEDAENLLECYSDKVAVSVMNADFCTSDFYYQTIESMLSCICLWLDEYVKGAYIRFAIICKSYNKAVGTVEIFGGKFGVLRIDICSEYENENNLSELICCAVKNFYDDFSINTIYFKTNILATERIKALKNNGFTPTDEFHSGLNYFVRKKTHPIAYCGLACCVCSENDTCVGCRNDGCSANTIGTDKNWCKNYNCCREKGLNGCWECTDFPCKGSMLDKLRIRAFARFVNEYGEDELVRCLLRNKENGVKYHYDGQLVGNYDEGKTEDEIIEIVKNGVYKKSCV